MKNDGLNIMNETKLFKNNQYHLRLFYWQKKNKKFMPKNLKKDYGTELIKSN